MEEADGLVRLPRAALWFGPALWPRGGGGGAEALRSGLGVCGGGGGVHRAGGGFSRERSRGRGSPGVGLRVKAAVAGENKRGFLADGFVCCAALTCSAVSLTVPLSVSSLSLPSGAPLLHDRLPLHVLLQVSHVIIYNNNYHNANNTSITFTEARLDFLLSF